MRNFGATPKKASAEEGYSTEAVNLGVLGAALTTQGLAGAGMGLIAGVIGVTAFEMLTNREVDPTAQKILVGGTALAFSAGVPAALLKLEGRY